MFRLRQKFVVSVLAVLATACACLLVPVGASAAATSTYERAVIQSFDKKPGAADSASVTMLSGAKRGQTLPATVGVPPGSFDLAAPRYNAGETVLVNQQTDATGGTNFTVVDHYRLGFAGWFLAAILVLAIVFAGWRGFGSIIGLILSVAVLAGYVIPQILKGQNPYVITGIGMTIISFVGIYVAHGFSRRTTLALVGTYLTLIVAVVLSVVAVNGLHLTGITSEDIFYLSQAKANLNIQGLLLCGMLISLIGILDDITVGQATSVEELYKANPNLSVRDVYNSGLKIGREHIASLINTLVLVFVGTSLLFITYLTALSTYPWLANLNSGLVMQEIARALVGSLTLIIAVPITTYLSARYLKPAKPPVK